MHLEILKSDITDNFFYLVADDERRAALIDPIDARVAIDAVRRGDYTLAAVINTHFHPDHVGGNEDVLAAFPDARLVAGRNERERIEAQMDRARVDEAVGEGDFVEVGGLRLRVLETPGHTPGHISLLSDEDLFCGDTIFAGGTGHCRFGGDTGVLFATFRDVVRRLEDAIRIYPGHDYAVRNIEFVLSLEPEQAAARRLLEGARAAREAGRLFATTVGQERTYNPFMRFDDPSLRRSLEASHGKLLAAQRELSQTEDEAVFRCLRELRNNW